MAGVKLDVLIPLGLYFIGVLLSASIACVLSPGLPAGPEQVSWPSI